ncbi:MAG: hypothetical protein HY900_13420 [Deltaproteobacteria bacterium]|nr:hypothetical protein [Deltaproteobacteria bacterium]
MNLRVPDAVVTHQDEIAGKVDVALSCRKQAHILLDRAKRAVEIAIEESEAAALAYLNEGGSEGRSALRGAIPAARPDPDGAPSGQFAPGRALLQGGARPVVYPTEEEPVRRGEPRPTSAARAAPRAALPRDRHAPRHIPQTILSHMEPDRAFSRAELCDALRLTPAEWTWAIRELKESGKVVQTGERRGARYALAGGR